jgi:hypothetical protein
MHRATPGTRTSPSFSNALTFAMACARIRGYVQHLRCEVGQHDASLRRQSRDAQTRLTRARGNVEMR